MSSDVEDILAAVHGLPLQEQREVLRRLTESLTSDDDEIARASANFWKSRSLDEIIREQNIKPIDDLSVLASSVWPEDESLDDFLDFIYGQRRADRDS